MRSQPAKDLRHRRHRPNDDSIEPLCGEQILTSGVVHGNRQPQAVDDLASGLGLLGHRITQFDVQIGPYDHHHDPRHAAAGPQIEHFVSGLGIGKIG